jgi:aminoglycoside phosphotransferase (APT) family kinase protein
MSSHAADGGEKGSGGGWPGEDALWSSVAATLEEDLLPALSGPAHAVALQLSGLARYALTRGADPRPGRAARLAGELGLDAAAPWAEVATAASDLLVASRAGDGADRTTADHLRSTLLSFVEEDFARAAPLLETFARHGTSLVGEDSTPAEEAVALQSWLGGKMGQAVERVAVRLMSGGHSRRMLDVSAFTSEGESRFVVRVEQGGVFGTEGGSEAAIMGALGRAGVPVAPVRWMEETGAVLGHPFFVMDRVEGEHEVDDAVLTTYVRALDELHRMPTAEVAAAFPVRPSDAREGVTAAIGHWEAVYRSASAEPIPLLEDAAAWLRTHLEPTGPLCVVHGDPGPGNFIHRDGQVVAFTDWEFGHLGDAAEDWVYLAAMRGIRVMPTEAWKGWLAERVGVEFDEATWKAWTVFNLFKGACANITALRVFTDGASHGANLLAVGTAVHLRMVRQITELIAAG